MGFVVGLAVLTQLITGVAAAKPVAPSAVSSSSNYTAEEGASFDAKQVADGKVTTVWVEGDAGSGLGSWIQLDLGAATTLQKVKIWGGVWSSGTDWGRANRPRELEFAFSDGTTQVFSLTNDMKAQEFALSPAPTTTSVKVKVKSVHNGSAWPDTGISEIQLFDAQPDSRHLVKGATASTTIKADADGSYEPAFVTDGIADTVWCEGDKGDGKGQWVEVDFGKTVKVSKLDLINGIGGSLKVWMKANRATKGTLTFSDASTAPIEIKNSMMPQSIAFPAKETTKVRLTIDEVGAGKEFNDLCLSEVQFSE